MRTLLKVIAISLADARRADELFAHGAKSALVADPERVLATFGLWRALGRVRVVRERASSVSWERSNAA